MAVHPDPLLPIRPLTVDDVLAMETAGIIGREDHIELIDGFLIEKEPMKPPHIHAMVELNMRAVPVAVAAGLSVYPQLPRDVLSDLHLPEPDLAIGPALRPGQRAPAAAVLVIEVADSSLRFDLGRKAQIYATAGIPEYWVLDVNGRRMHVHAEPMDGGFAAVAVHDEHAVLAARGLPFTVRVADLLQPATAR